MTFEQTQRYRVFLREFTDSAGIVPGLRVMGEERRIVAATAAPPTSGLWQDGSRGDEKGNSDLFYL